MKLYFSIDGVEKFKFKADMLTKEVRNEAKKAMFRGGTLIEARAREHLEGMHGHPRHWITGNLAGSIQVKVGWINLYEIMGVIGTDVPYAVHVEALPDGGYMFPALMNVGPEALEYVISGIKQIIKDAQK